MSHIHVPDGIIPVALWVGGYVLTLIILMLSVKSLKGEEVRRKIPLVGIVAAIMLIGMSVPLGIIPVHISLAVLSGILIGPKLGFIAVFVVNLMLALFGHGGITLVGLNTLIVGSEVLIGYYVFLYLSRKFKQLTSIIAATALALVTSLTMMALLVGFTVGFEEAVPHHHAYAEADEAFEWHGLVQLQQGSYQLVFEEADDDSIDMVILKHEDHLEAEHDGEEKEALEVLEENIILVSKDNLIVISDKTGYRLELEEKQTIYNVEVEEAGEYILFLQHHPSEFDMKLIAAGGAVVTLNGEDDHHHDHHGISETKYLFLTGWSALVLIILVAIAVEALGTAFIVGFFTKIRPDLVATHSGR